MADQPIPLDDAIHAEVRHELSIAKAKFGESHFDVLCIEGSWGDTLSDRMTLRLLRTLNRTNSMYAEIICRV